MRGIFVGLESRHLSIAGRETDREETAMGMRLEIILRCSIYNYVTILKTNEL